MGMFDYLKCEIPLPLNDHLNRGFQTKDLDNSLDYYVITKSGELIRHHLMENCYTGSKIEPTKENYNGFVDFYDFDNLECKMIEYRAFFNFGLCREISLFTENGDLEVVWKNDNMTQLETTKQKTLDNFMKCFKDKGRGIDPKTYQPTRILQIEITDEIIQDFKGLFKTPEDKARIFDVMFLQNSLDNNS